MLGASKPVFFALTGKTNKQTITENAKKNLKATPSAGKRARLLRVVD